MTTNGSKMGRHTHVLTDVPYPAEPALVGLPTAFTPTSPAILHPLTNTTPDSWAKAASGVWTTGSAWSTGKAPTSSNDATISVAGTYTVTVSAAAAANSLTVTEATAKVVDNAALSLTTTLSLAAGSFTLGSGGVLTAGTVIVGAGASFTSTAGALSGVTFDGTLGVTAAYASVTLTGTDTFAGVGGTGAGTINLTGNAARLYAQDNTLLDNATLNLGSASTAAYIDVQSLASSDDTLTLGSHFNLVQSAASSQGTIDLYSYTGDSGTLVNQGTITASASKGYLSIYGRGYADDAFVNTGTIAVSNGDTLDLSQLGTFANTGTLSATGSLSTVNFGGVWSEQGVLSAASDATLNLGGTFTVASTGTITNSGGTVNLTGLLNNAGTTFAVGSAITLGGGTIAGGTVAVGSAGTFTSTAGTLSGVTFDGTLGVTAAYASLTLTGTDTFAGVGGTGAGTINLTGNGSSLSDGQNYNLSNLLLNFGSTSAGSTLDIADGGTLTLGNNLSLVQSVSSTSGTILVQDYSSDAGTLINQGTIAASASKGYLSVRDYYGYANTVFTNSGSIVVNNGDILDLSSVGSFVNTGMLSASGTATTVILARSSNTSTISLTNGATLNLASTLAGGTLIDNGGIFSGAGTLSSVAVQGIVDLSAANASLYITSIDSFAGAGGTGPGLINLTGAGSTLNGAQIYELNNLTLDFGSTSGGSTLAIADGGTLTLGTNLSLVQSAAGASGTILVQDYSSDAGTLVNQGTIAASASKGYLTVRDYEGYANAVFTNSGSIAVSNADTLDLSSISSFIKSGMLSATGSATTVSLAGSSNTGTISLSSGATLNLVGTLAGGTLIDNGAIFSGAGTLSGVAVQGAVDLSAANASLNITGTDTFSNLGGTGPGTINLTGSGATLAGGTAYLY